MAFTVRDFHDLVKLLREHPEWREELRALLLAPEILSLPQLIRELAEKVDRLAAAQARAEEHLSRVEERLGLLEERMAEFAAAQARTELAVGDLKGITLELRWRERAPAFLGKLVRRARLLSDAELMDLLDTEEAQAVLSEEDRDDLLQADFVVVGRRKSDGAEVYLVGEVSFVVDDGDVERARRRADSLSRLGITALPVVAGHSITPEAERLARHHEVLRILDGAFFLD